jgi:hypothetical protein
MPGNTTTTQQQQQQSSTAPWSPAIPAVTGVLNSVASNPTGPNASQTGAISTLENNANSATNFGAPVSSVATGLLNGGNPAYTGILNGAYNTLQSNLTPVANGSMIGNNPALSGELGTIANDTQNAVESQFAAAGRGGPGAISPAEAQAIARGTAQGEAPVMANQYNTDVSNMLGANSTLFGAGTTTGTGLNAMTTGNEGLGINAASLYPGILNSNATSLLNAGNLEQSLPFQGTGLEESQLLPIAGLGAESTGSSTGTTVQQQPLGPTLMGGILGGTALLGSGGLNVLGPAGAALMGLSDARVKKDIKHVGILNSGDNLYEFRFKGDAAGKKHVGVLAQEVERKHPEDVREIGGVKHVNYEGILRRAA